MLSNDQIRVKLLNYLTQYDIRASKRKGYNMYALGHYMRALDDVMEQLSKGATVRTALLSCFVGRLLDGCLTAVGEPPFTVEEMHRQNRML